MHDELGICQVRPVGLPKKNQEVAHLNLRGKDTIRSNALALTG